MPFDLSTAKKVQEQTAKSPNTSSGFNLDTAKKIDLDNEQVYDQLSGDTFDAPVGLSEGELELERQVQVNGENKENFFGDVNIGSPIDLPKRYIGGIIDSGLSLATVDEGYVESRLQEINMKMAQGETSDWRNWFFQADESRGFEAEKAKLEKRLSKIKDLRARKPDVKEGMGLGGGDSVLGDIGAGGQSLAMSMGSSIVMQTPKAAAFVFGAQQRTDSYEEARAAGFSIEKSNEMANVRATSQGVIEAVGVDALFKVTGGVGKRVLKSALTNAVEEGSQELADIGITNSYELTNINFEEGLGNVLYSAFIGGLVGAPVGVVSGSNNTRKTNISKEEIALAEAFINKLITDNPQLKQQFDDNMSRAMDVQTGDFKFDPANAEAVNQILSDFENGVMINMEDYGVSKEDRDAVSLAAEAQIQAMKAEQKQKVESDAEILSGFKDQIGEIRSIIAGGDQAIKKPMIDYVKKAGRVKTGSALAAELNNMGINPQTAPALFKNDGQAGDLDNIPIDEFTAQFPDLSPIDDGNGYVDRGYLLDQIQKEYAGSSAAGVDETFVRELSEMGLDPETVTPEELFEAVEGRPPNLPDPIEESIGPPAEIPQDIEIKDLEQSEDFAKAAGKIAEKYEVEQYAFNAPPAPDGPVMRVAKDFGVGVEKYFTPISTRVKNINEKLFSRLRRYEYDVKARIFKDNEAIVPLLQKMRSLPPNAKAALDLAMKNRNIEVIDEIGSAYNMQAELDAVRPVFDEIFNRAQEANIEIEYLENHFPRRIKDLTGLMDYIQQDEGAWNVMQEALSQKEKTIGRPLTQEEKAIVLDNLLLGRKVEGISLARRGVFKERSIEEVTSEIDQFYETSEQAMLAYIYIANEAIETNKLFGRKPSNTGFAIDTEQSVGELVNGILADGDITNTEAQILTEILNARFNPQRMGEIVSTLRDAGYIATMGSPLNALTQVGDLATSIYNAGMIDAFTTLPMSMLDKTRVTLADIKIEDIAQEFDNQNKTSTAVDWTFRHTGLSKIDRIGKLNLVNSALKKYEKQAAKSDPALIKELELHFDGDAVKVLQDLKNKEVTEDVKILLFNKLLDFQPVARSEMPEAYLRAKNGKIFYMLKSFTLRQLDIYRREGFAKIRKGMETGDKKLVAAGLANTVRLAALWVVMGSSADYMKDFLKSLFGGSEIEDPEDYVIENLYKAFGLNKYTFDQINRPFLGDTPVEAAFSMALPPTKTMNNLWYDFKDIKKNGWQDPNDLKTIRSIPIGGELYYFWFGGGSGGDADDGKINLLKK